MLEFCFRRSGVGGTTVGMVLGIAMIALGVMSLTLSNSGGTGIGIGMMFVVMNIVKRGQTMVTLYSDHIDLKVAALARRHEILYQDISAIEERGPKRLIIVTGDRRIVVPLVALEPNDQIAFIAALKQRVAPGAWRTAENGQAL
jgi:hypothetical protein